MSENVEVVSERAQFCGKADPRDLATFFSRARAVDSQVAVKLLSRGKALAAYVAVLAPATLLDAMPTVLGMRAVPLENSAHIDTVVEASALLDRLARIEDEGLKLTLPPVTVNAAWAGITPPLSGWQLQGSIDAETLRRTAKEGMDAVDQALPQNPGHAVLDTVRSRIWSSPLPGFEMPIPAGVAFAAEVLGFLPSKSMDAVSVYTADGWVRLNAPGGYVLARV
ncbi:transcriptional regulator [Rothia terrae]|uniref:transcriptional regulator n=1 Tax=Rothia terrae TaxID=396015 RepID=UPI0033E08B7C